MRTTGIGSPAMELQRRCRACSGRQRTRSSCPIKASLPKGDAPTLHPALRLDDNLVEHTDGMVLTVRVS